MLFFLCRGKERVGKGEARVWDGQGLCDGVREGGQSGLQADSPKVFFVERLAVETGVVFFAFWQF